MRTAKLERAASMYKASREVYILARAVLFDSLEAKQLEAYEYVCTHPGTTSAQLADALGIKINYASSVLSQLYESHLLNRRDTRNQDGREYIYEVIP